MKLGAKTRIREIRQSAGSPDLTQEIEGFGLRKLLAEIAGDEATAANFALILKAAEHE
jgi:hypothetical protein